MDCYNIKSSNGENIRTLRQEKVFLQCMEERRNFATGFSSEHKSHTESFFNTPNCKEKSSDAGSIRKNLNDDAVIVDSTKFQAAKRTFLEYFHESSIHGFKYISNHKHSFGDRIIWLCALVISIITCCFLIRNLWDQRNNNPVIITVNDKLTHVWEIPFPTVTICTETKIHHGLFNFTETFWKVKQKHNINKKELVYWESSLHICNLKRQLKPFYGKSLVYRSGSQLKEIFDYLAPGLRDDYFTTCTWRDSFDCFDKLESVLTEDGICFSFNSLTSKHYQDELKDARIQYDNFYKADSEIVSKWNIENGYNDDEAEKQDSFPLRVIGAGEAEGLHLSLLSNRNDYEPLCRNFKHGYKVIVHTPGEEPNVSKNFIRVPFEKSVLISIKPEIVSSSIGLKIYEPHIRQCYFKNERPLRYFKEYNQPNCELECLANQTLAECGCVKFWMPRSTFHSVCGSSHFECVDQVRNHIGVMKFSGENLPIPSQSNISYSSCDCLPLCKSIQYKAELEHQEDYDFRVRGYLLQMTNISDYDYKHINQETQITIKFQDDVFVGLKRTELYSQTDFIAKCGGLLGLFMGVSIISAVEFVYFFTVRLWINLKSRTRKNGE